MTTTIRVKFGDEPRKDGCYAYRLVERLPLLEEVMRRSVKPFEVKRTYLYDDVGGIAGAMWVFYVDEFYENIVLDLVNNLNWDGLGWFDWYRNKYGIKVA